MTRPPGPAGRLLVARGELARQQQRRARVHGVGAGRSPRRSRSRTAPSRPSARGWPRPGRRAARSGRCAAATRRPGAAGSARSASITSTARRSRGAPPRAPRCRPRRRPTPGRRRAAASPAAAGRRRAAASRRAIAAPIPARRLTPVTSATRPRHAGTPRRAAAARISSASASISRPSCHSPVARRARTARITPTGRKPAARVAGDRRRVGGRRVDGQPVVPAVADEVDGQRRARHRRRARAVDRRVEEHVDPGVPVVRLVLLGVLDHPDDGAVVLDGEAHGVGLVGGREVVLERAPPAHHARAAGGSRAAGRCRPARAAAASRAGRAASCPWRHRRSAATRPGRLAASAAVSAVRPRVMRTCVRLMYAELHAHSAFSFLDGASLPDELAGAAARARLRRLRADRPQRAVRLDGVRPGRQGGRASRRSTARRSTSTTGATSRCWSTRRRAGATCAASSRARTRTRAIRTSRRRPCRWRRSRSTPPGSCA